MFDLKPGDVLLYSGKSIFSFAIKIKTWSIFSHVEMYIGNGKTAGSREGHGIQTFKFEEENLAAILRLIDNGFGIDLSKALDFHQSCVGQKYDYFGLFRFFRLGAPSLDKSFCSEHCTRLLRKVKIFTNEEQTAWTYARPFSTWYDADLVSPGMFWSSPAFDLIWTKVSIRPWN